MPRKPKHKEAIVDAAVRLFRRGGYAATGLNDIVEASGAPKGSLYYYFPHGKPSIAEAAVIEAGRRVAATLQELATTATSTADLLQAHARQLAGWMSKSGYRDGCPITTVLLELAPEDRAVTKAGRDAYAERIAIFRQRLLDDGIVPARAAALAAMCTSTLQGALIQARVERSGRPLIDAALELGELLPRPDVA
ncbi:transcriptional regulator, TetR family [Rhodopseudomonas palustris TIE-1]|uniref:TetR/AcrR family transcriptional regulator n=1 Tax=Rhodopseudomonas palustris TaxID=1076 RepID=UPI000164BBEA|nr:TetR/AcrR family transcriptional regulator [Rhodopseudomonas palustris]ACE98834.1 transcriptional regulator, TetR family [Rhodopseudomonas palustris TIE-1]